MYRSRVLFPAFAVAVLGIAGCAQAAPAPAVTETAPTFGPVSADNCGTVVEFSVAPERVITIKSTSTEMLLALGLGDRIIGTAFQDGPVAEEWADAAADLSVLAEKVPSQEVVLEAAPDLVYAGWESNFSAEGAGERSSLQDLGINTYVSPAACKEDGYKPARLSFANVFSEIEEVASIFHVDASELIADQREILDGITPSTEGYTALWFSSGSDTPYVGAGIGAPQLILDTIGVTNIAGEIGDTWSPFNWEAVVDANPDVIVLVDASWSSVEKKIGVLEANPATANLDAVKNGRYLIIPFAAGEAGVRTAAAAADLAEQLAALDLG